MAKERRSIDAGGALWSASVGGGRSLLVEGAAGGLGANRLVEIDRRVERRRFARRAYALGRKALSELDTLVTPDTTLAALAARFWQ